MNEIKAPRDRSLKPCACSRFEAEESLDGGESSRIYGTACSRMTNNLFAQGHDAKLVSFLVKAELTGDDIRWETNGGYVFFKEAAKAAAAVSDALAAKAERAVLNALDKLAASGKLQNGKGKGAIKPQAPREVAVKPVSTETATSSRVDVGTPVRGKVGRWTYDGYRHSDGSFSYNRKGQADTLIVDADKWTEVK